MSKPKASQKPKLITSNPYFWIITISIGALIYLVYLSYINFIKPAPIEITQGEPRELPQQPCPSMVYSKTGKGYQRDYYNHVDYIGNAPLYLVKEEVVAKFNISIDCPIYPPNIPIKNLRDDVFVYPIEINGKIYPENTNITVGESFEVVAQAEVKDKFSNTTWAIDLTPNKRDYLEFYIHGLDFDFDPPKEYVIPVVFTNNLSAKQHWTAAPAEKAIGRKYLGVDVKGEKFQGSIIVKLEVRQILGINPYVLAFSSLITTVISVIITMVGQIVTIRKDLQSGANSGNSKENKHE